MFDQAELQLLVGGSHLKFDVDDLRAHTHYSGGYHAGHPAVLAFWEVVMGFDDVQRAALLRFATSCSRPPLLGFAHLNPSFALHRVPLDADPERLPTSSTCMNLLKLP